MSASHLQEIFLRELADTFAATEQHIVQRLAALDPTDEAARTAFIREQLRGLYHGILVIFDGGTPLADHGLVRIVDDEGVAFDRWLHEICFRYWPSSPAGD